MHGELQWQCDVVVIRPLGKNKQCTYRFGYDGINAKHESCHGMELRAFRSISALFFQ